MVSEEEKMQVRDSVKKIDRLKSNGRKFIRKKNCHLSDE